jgi:hypothetical protein
MIIWLSTKKLRQVKIPKKILQNNGRIFSTLLSKNHLNLPRYSSFMRTFVTVITHFLTDCAAFFQHNYLSNVKPPKANSIAIQNLEAV